jgi:transcriptional regulator with XRE-family HTH domain
MPFRKPQNVQQQPKTLFGQELQRLMEEKNLSLKDLSDKTGSTYEYMRLLARGQNLPSVYFVRAAAAALGTDVSHLENLVKQDKFNRDFGSMVPPAQAAALSPELVPFVRAWPKLDDTQRNTLLQMLKAFVGQQTAVASTDRRG